MREAIGGTWLFGLVITFIVFFASFLAVSINYANAFNVKNNVVDLITKYEGNNNNAREKIGAYLSETGYLVPGNCVDNYIPYGLDGKRIYDGNKGYYCLAREKVEGTSVDKTYYRVMIFFRIDLPMIGELTTFRIKGETEAIYYATDDEIKYPDEIS